jgi:curved DNA-binding protein CbpA
MAFGDVDYYAVLGVAQSAEEVVIRAAYRALSQRYHPDRFQGNPEEANRRMQELNIAYAVLSDPVRRREYNAKRGAGPQSADSSWDDEPQDSNPTGDPLDADWKVALKFYPDLAALERDLSVLAWRLGSAFKAYMLESKAFEKRREIADRARSDFLESYFGTNKDIHALAYEFIIKGNRAAALDLNSAVRVLGSVVDAMPIVDKVIKEHLHVDLQRRGIFANAGVWWFQNTQYRTVVQALRAAEGKPEMPVDDGKFGMWPMAIMVALAVIALLVVALSFT